MGFEPNRQSAPLSIDLSLLAWSYLLLGCVPIDRKESSALSDSVDKDIFLIQNG